MEVRSGRALTPCVSEGSEDHIDDEDPTLFRDWGGISQIHDLIQGDEPSGYVSPLLALQCAPNSLSEWTLVVPEFLRNGHHVPNKLLCTCTKGCSKCNTTRGLNEYWMIDSGASLHFTHSRSDFISYKPAPTTAGTAAETPLTIEGFGAVIIKHELKLKGKKAQTKYLRLFPVLYAPKIVGRLLSLGQFLRQGLRVYGDAATLTLVTSDKSIPMMQFAPLAKGETLYWLKGAATNALHTSVVFSVDYNTLHN